MTDQTKPGHSDADWRDPITRSIAMAALAKHGITLSDSADTPIATLLEERSGMRRAVNEITERSQREMFAAGNDLEKVERISQAATKEVKAISAFITRLQGEIDRKATAADLTASRQVGGEVWEVNGQPTRVLRNAADIRAHYRVGAQLGAAESDVTLASFLRGVAGLGATPGVRAALSIGTDTAGGYAVPSVVMPGILEAMIPSSSLLTAGAGILPLTEGAKTFSVVAVDAIPTAAWRNEGANVAESDPTFRAAVAAPKSLAFYFKVSRELLQDAAGMDQALRLSIAQAFAKELDRAGLRGTGTAPQPRGILSTTNVLAVGNGANGASLASTKYANFLTAVQQLLEADAPMPGAAIMSPRSRVVLASAADSTGQPLQVPPLLSQLQMLSTSQVPNNLVVGSSSDCSEIYVGDFRRVLFAMREQVSIQVLSEAFATTGQVGFIGHARVDVLVTYPKCFAVVTGVRP